MNTQLIGDLGNTLGVHMFSDSVLNIDTNTLDSIINPINNDNGLHIC